MGQQRGADSDMIREATMADMPDLLRLAAAAHNGAGLSKPDARNGFWFPFDAEITARQIGSHIRPPTSLVALYVVDDRPEGCIIAAATNYPNAPLRLAAELVFWIEPAHRGRGGPMLLEHFESWAASQGCQFAHISSKRDPRFAKWLDRRGYAPVETQHLKPLKAA